MYEYECPKCGEHFELLRKMSDSEQDEKCPKCGAENAFRIFSSFASTSGGACDSGKST
jgi:putative FmdB family regulatory protein